MLILKRKQGALLTTKLETKSFSLSVFLWNGFVSDADRNI